MKIRDSRAAVNGEFETTQMPSGSLDIIADDGRTLFSIRLKDGALEINSGGVCQHDGIVLSEALLIAPRYANNVTISRSPYVPK
jgi:hypothetical protein